MQVLIAKYGLAAHLALLAVAPLFLFPFFGEEVVSLVVLWLSFPAAIWTVMEPSLHRGELPHIARKRVVRSIVSDPLTWMMVILIGLTGFRTVNAGIGLSYNAEISKWFVSNARFPLLPGCVEGSGFYPFCSTIALTVLLIGCRHSLGRSARMAFLQIASSLAGLASVIAILLAANGNGSILKLMECPPLSCSYVGTAFAVYFIASLVSVIAAFEYNWYLAMPFMPLSIGGTFAGMFVFSPIRVSLVFVAAALVVGLYSFVFSFKALRDSGAFKLLVVIGISITLGWLLSAATLPSNVVSSRVAAVMSVNVLPKSLLEVRSVLSAIAMKSWLANLWLGTGLGSFPLDFRFAAKASDWALVKGNATMLPNGWLMLMAERGIVGAVSLALTVGMLWFTYFKRMVGWIQRWELPHAACFAAPLAFVALVLTGLYDCSFMRGDVLMACGTLMVVSASSFPLPRKRRKNG